MDYNWDNWRRSLLYSNIWSKRRQEIIDAKTCQIIDQGCQISHPNWVRLSPNWINLGLLKISFSTFWLAEPKCTETDFKKSQICPIWFFRSGPIWPTLGPNLANPRIHNARPRLRIHRSMWQEAIDLAGAAAHLTSDLLVWPALSDVHGCTDYFRFPGRDVKSGIQIGSDCPQMGQIRDFFRLDFRTFGSIEKER